MRFVVFGAGGIGGVVGGRLAQNGHSVVLIARGRHFDAIRDRGLRIESPDDAVELRLPVVDHPSSIAWTKDDVVLLATKSQDTAAALHDLASVAAPTTPVICLQNGVENERAALRRFPAVYGVYVWCPTAYMIPGVVQAWCAPVTGIFDIGRYPSGTDDLAEHIAAAFRSASFLAEPRADIMRWKYRKLLSNLGNAVEALCGPAGRGSSIILEARREGIDCLHAAGISFVTDEEDSVRREDALTLRPIHGQKRGGGSTWQSIERHTGKVETDYLNGEIVLLGRLHGVPTPVNALLQQLTRMLARSSSPAGSMPVERILALLT